MEKISLLDYINFVVGADGTGGEDAGKDALFRHDAGADEAGDLAAVGSMAFFSYLRDDVESLSDQKFGAHGEGKEFDALGGEVLGEFPETEPGHAQSAHFVDALFSEKAYLPFAPQFGVAIALNAVIGD